MMYQETLILHDVRIILLTAVDCGNLTDPANGSVNHTAGTTFGQNATYSCDTGYNLVGDSTRTCNATGNWSESEPTCERMLLKAQSHSYGHINKKHNNTIIIRILSMFQSNLKNSIPRIYRESNST